jgi:hypothetical protein
VDVPGVGALRVMDPLNYGEVEPGSLAHIVGGMVGLATPDTRLVVVDFGSGRGLAVAQFAAHLAAAVGSGALGAALVVGVELEPARLAAAQGLLRCLRAGTDLAGAPLLPPQVDLAPPALQQVQAGAQLGWCVQEDFTSPRLEERLAALLAGGEIAPGLEVAAGVGTGGGGGGGGAGGVPLPHALDTQGIFFLTATAYVHTAALWSAVLQLLRRLAPLAIVCTENFAEGHGCADSCALAGLYAAPYVCLAQVTWQRPPVPYFFFVRKGTRLRPPPSLFKQWRYGRDLAAGLAPKTRADPEFCARTTSADRAWEVYRNGFSLL